MKVMAPAGPDIGVGVTNILLQQNKAQSCKFGIPSWAPGKPSKRI